MSDPAMIKEIMEAVTIPVMAKARIGHFVECQVCCDTCPLTGELAGSRGYDEVGLSRTLTGLFFSLPAIRFSRRSVSTTLMSPRFSPLPTMFTTLPSPHSRSPSFAVAATSVRPCAVSPRALP